jgi:hypothetical protein
MSTCLSALSLGSFPIACTRLIGREADRATALLLQRTREGPMARAQANDGHGPGWLRLNVEES